jgi:urea carboxylase-associated protein 1
MAGILLEGANVSKDERARHAREVAAKNRAEAMARMAELKARVGPGTLERAATVTGTVVSDEIVPAGGRWSHELAAGTHLRIIDLEGRQAVDFLCWDAVDPSVRYNAANTIKLNRSIFIGKGSRLYSDKVEPMMSVVDDTVGLHDTIGGCCSSEANELRYGIPNTPCCRDNFIAAIAGRGLGPRDIPANVNFFMYVPVEPDGSTAIVEGKSQPGDFVDLRAERDVFVAISNCPQLYNPCNGWNPTPIRLIVWRE